MIEKNKNDDHFQMTFSDLWAICRKRKKTIIFWTLAFAFGVGLFQISRPIQYQAKSTFREKSKTGSDSTKSLSLAMLMGGGDANENAALSMMKSRRLAEQVIREKNFQAFLRKEGWKWDLLGNIRDNLKVEWAALRNIQEPVIPDRQEPIKVIALHYEGEIPIKLKVRFTSEDTFSVADRSGKEIGSGALGWTFNGPHYSFVLVRQNEEPLAHAKFQLKLDSVVYAANKQLAKFKCESDSRDKCLIKLSYKHPSRHEASDYLNTAMAFYQFYLRDEHRRISNEQIAYLNKRQDETGLKLKSMMEEHAHALTTNMATMDFLFQTQQSYTQKLLLIDMELRRLQKARHEGIVFYERYWIDGGDPAVINKMLSDIREYKQQADSIDIALRNVTPEDPDQLKEIFNNQLNELENIRYSSKEAKALYAALQNNRPLPTVLRLYNNPKYMIREWQQKLCQNKENDEVCKSNFNAYLANLIHLIDVEEKIVQERLRHQQGPQLEFQGIDLPTANQLYINYSKSLNDCEAEILHDEFILNQMKDPNFEPSSLSSVLEDSVSREIISRASNLLLMIRDHDNRSQKELERLRAELDQQKGFLALHLEQTIQLLQLRKKLFREKILSVQNAQLELIQQKISVLEQHLADYIDSRIVNMKQEREAIEQQQEALKAEMEKMPEKWSSEKLIEQHLEMSRKMVEEITKMIESKNISAHLDISQSAPVDVAVTPIHPVRSYFILVAILGGFFGFLLSSTIVLGKAVAKGVPVSADNLKAEGLQVAGSFSKAIAWPNAPIRDDDLNTLRHLCAFLSEGRTYAGGQSVLLMIGKTVDYSIKLAELLHKEGRKVLLMRISFDRASQEEESPGLLAYLNGEASKPKIMKKGGMDYVAAGGISRFSSEYLKSDLFQVLLNQYKNEYDWVIAVSTTVPQSGEGQNLAPLFDHAILSISDENWGDLQPYFGRAPLSFVFPV